MQASRRRTTLSIDAFPDNCVADETPDEVAAARLRILGGDGRAISASIGPVDQENERFEGDEGEKEIVWGEVQAEVGDFRAAWGCFGRVLEYKDVWIEFFKRLFFRAGFNSTSSIERIFCDSKAYFEYKKHSKFLVRDLLGQYSNEYINKFLSILTFYVFLNYLVKKTSESLRIAVRTYTYKICSLPLFGYVLKNLLLPDD